MNNKFKNSWNMNIRMKKVLLIVILQFAATGISHANVKGEGWFVEIAEPTTPDNANAYLDSVAHNKAANMSETVETIMLSAQSSPSTPELDPVVYAQKSALQDSVADELTILAQGLQNDPVQIFDYVVNHINYDPYFGQLKGALLTHLDRSGNDFDQASLLHALLSEAGYLPQFVYGEMTIPVNDTVNQRDMLRWLGIEGNGDPSENANQARAMVSNGGIPTTVITITGTDKRFLRLSRVWVRVSINGTVHDLDPAFKKTRKLESTIDLVSASGLNKAELLTSAGGDVFNDESTSDYDTVQGLNDAQGQGLDAKLTEYTMNLVQEIKDNYSSSSVDEILERLEIDPYDINTLPTTPFFPYTQRNVWNEIPAQFQHTVRLQHASIDETVPIKRIAGKKLSLHYDGATTNPVAPNLDINEYCNDQDPTWTWQFGSIYQSQEFALPCGFSLPSDENVTSIEYTVEILDTANGSFRLLIGEDEEPFERYTDIVYGGQSESFKFKFYGHNDQDGDDVLDGEFLSAGSKSGSAKLTLRSRVGSSIVKTDEYDITLLGRIDEEPKAIFSLNDVPIFDNDLPTYQNNHKPLTITVDHPYAGSNGEGTLADQYTDYDVNKGDIYVIGSSFGEISGSKAFEERQRFFQKQLAENSSATDTEKLTETLHMMGLTWLRQSNATQDLLAGFTNTRVSTPHRLGLIGLEQSYFVDFKTQSNFFTQRGAGETIPASLFPSMSFFASALEHGVLEQLQGADKKTVSTISILSDKNEVGERTLLLSSQPNSTTKTELEDNGYQPALVDSFDDLLSGGSSAEFEYILLPESPIQINDWDGYGYIAYRPFDPSSNNLSGRILMAIGRNQNFINGGFSTIKGPPASQPILNDIIFDTAPPPLSISNNTVGGCPVNFNTGAKQESFTDMIAGTIGFTRSYDSSFNNQLSSLGLGWRHNLDIEARVHSNENAALGFRTPADMAPIIIAQLATLELVGNMPEVKDWSVASLVNDWAMRQLQDNAVTIRAGIGSQAYIKMPDRSYLSPPQNTNTLTRTNNTYKLTSRFGTVTQFDSDNRISTITDIDGNATTFAYANDQLSSVQDNFGNSLTFTYIGDNVNNVTDHAGRSVSFTYLNDTLNQINDVDNQLWEYQYDNEGRLTKRLNPLQQAIKEVVYNGLGKVATQSWPRQAGLAVEQYQYAEFDTTVIDPLSHQSISQFDDQNRTIKSVNALNEATSRTYDGQSRVIETQDALGRVSKASFDKDHNLRTSTNPLNEVTTLDYDAQHRHIKTTDPLGNISETTYDAEHHPISNTIYPKAGDAITITSDYYPNGQIKTITDAKGAVSNNTYDVRGYQDTSNVTYTDDTGTVTTPNVDKDYDALGRLTKLTDQEGAITQFAYNNRGNVTQITDPQNNTTTMTYDALGRLKTTTDRNGDTATVNYTISGQIDNVDYPNSSEDVAFTYDLRDQVNTMSDGLGLTDFDYDELGRLTQTTDPHGFIVKYTYNAVGNLSTLTYPNNNVVTYTYDALNRLKTLENWLSEVTTYHYDQAGRIDYIQNANGSTIDYTFDNANRLLKLTNKKSTGELITEQIFTLDKNGNRESEFRTQPQAPQEIASELSYQYNPQKTRLNTVTDTEDNDIITTFTYDDEGQQTQKNTNARTFDSRHRLKSQHNKTYHYDANNNRLKVEHNNKTSYYIYDANNNLLAEADATKTITRYYIHGSGLNQMIQTVANQEQSYTYHHSVNGHTLAITDENEDIKNQYAYSPFGRILGETETAGLEQPFKYVGKHGVQHEQGEIYYMRARYYDAEIGRFLKEDPIGFEGGLNVSLYVGGNPVVGIDPSGLAQEICGNYCYGLVSAANGGVGPVIGLAGEVGNIAVYDSELGSIHLFSYGAIGLGVGLPISPVTGAVTGEFITVKPTSIEQFTGSGVAASATLAAPGAGATVQFSGNLNQGHLASSVGVASGLTAGGSLLWTNTEHNQSFLVGNQCFGN